MLSCDCFFVKTCSVLRGDSGLRLLLFVLPVALPASPLEIGGFVPVVIAYDIAAEAAVLLSYSLRPF